MNNCVYYIFRRRPRSQRILFIKSNDLSKEKPTGYDDLGKRNDDRADNKQHTDVANAMSAEELKVFDESNHIYHTVNVAQGRIYKNLLLRDDAGDKEKVDVFEAINELSDRVNIVDVHTAGTAQHGRSNATEEYLNIHRPMEVPTNDHILKANVEHVNNYHREMSAYKDLENIYVEPDYLDMSAVRAKYRRISQKRSNTKHVGSLYRIHKPRKINFFNN